MFHYSGCLHSLLKRGIHWIEIIGKNLPSEVTVRIIFGTPVKTAKFAPYIFVDSKPTPLNPNLTLVTGYNTDIHATLLPPSGKRKRKLNFAVKVKGKKKKALHIFQCSQRQLIQNQHDAEILTFSAEILTNKLLILTFQAKLLTQVTIL